MVLKGTWSPALNALRKHIENKSLVTDTGEEHFSGGGEGGSTLQ